MISHDHRTSDNYRGGCYLRHRDDVRLTGNLAEHGVAAVQPWAHDGGDEELTAVGVGARVGHGEEAGAFVLQFEVLVSKFAACCWHGQCKKEVQVRRMV